MNGRIEILRQLMQEEHLAALVISSRYAHGTTCVPDRWAAVTWLTAINDLQATVVVTKDKAAMWTDAATYEHVRVLMADSDIELLKEELDHVASASEWIARQLADVSHAEVGLDGMQMSATAVGLLVKNLRKAGGITVRTNVDVLQRVWKERPLLPQASVDILSVAPDGVSVADRVEQVRRALRTQHADGMLISSAEDVAWVLNIDPICVSEHRSLAAYLLISSTSATLYISKQTLTSQTLTALQEAGVTICDYEDVQQGLRDYFEYNILLDPSETSYTLYQSAMREVVSAPSPVAVMRQGGEVKAAVASTEEKTTSSSSEFRPTGIPIVVKRPNGCLCALGWFLAVIGGLTMLLSILFFCLSLSGLSSDDESEPYPTEEAVDSTLAQIDRMMAEPDSIFLTDEQDSVTSDTSEAFPPVTFEIDSITGDTTYVYDDEPLYGDHWDNPYRESIGYSIGLFLSFLAFVVGLVFFIPGLVILLVYYQNKKRYRLWANKMGIMP